MCLLEAPEKYLHLYYLSATLVTATVSYYKRTQWRHGHRRTSHHSIPWKIILVVRVYLNKVKKEEYYQLYRSEVVTACCCYCLDHTDRSLYNRMWAKYNVTVWIGARGAETNMHRQKNDEHGERCSRRMRWRYFPLVLVLKRDWKVATKGWDLWGTIKLVLNIDPVMWDDDACAAVAGPEAAPPPRTLAGPETREKMLTEVLCIHTDTDSCMCHFSTDCVLDCYWGSKGWCSHAPLKVFLVFQMCLKVYFLLNTTDEHIILSEQIQNIGSSNINSSIFTPFTHLCPTDPI